MDGKNESDAGKIKGVEEQWGKSLNVLYTCTNPLQ